MSLTTQIGPIVQRSRSSTLRVAVVGTYPPTRCGIATFTADVESTLTSLGTDVEVLDVGADGRIDPHDPESFRRAAAHANTAADIVLVQHEFGIFGGPAGSNLMQFTQALTIPYVVTYHTVLPEFDSIQAEVVKTLNGNAAAVTVFTATARLWMLNQGLAARRKLRVIAHGAPAELYEKFDPTALRKHFGIEPTRTVACTFGLLSEGKGIETVIAAMPTVLRDVPDLVYVVAGRTHPEVVRSSGESYRQRLEDLVDDLALHDHVQFVDRFLTIDELASLLKAADLFCTPYRNENQIVSGALTFALAAGLPVVSTRYQYAQDALVDGAGRLVEPDDVSAFADAMVELLVDGVPRREALIAAQRSAQSMAWHEVGRQLAEVLADAVRPTTAIPVRSPRMSARTAALPAEHRLRGRVPLADHGYRVDDAGRVLPVAAELARTDR